MIKPLTRRACYQFRVLNAFTKQWQRDYLLSLRERKINKTKMAKSEPIKEEDIVVLEEGGMIRALWKLAKVIETLPGKDGLIRAAKIHLLSGDKLIQLRRPIQHLIPLEAET